MPWNRPGTNGLSTSASTAMWISVAETPTSVAFGFSLLDCACAGTAYVIATATTSPTTTSNVRNFFMFPPRNG